MRSTCFLRTWSQWMGSWDPSPGLPDPLSFHLWELFRTSENCIHAHFHGHSECPTGPPRHHNAERHPQAVPVWEQSVYQGRTFTVSENRLLHPDPCPHHTLTPLRWGHMFAPLGKNLGLTPLPPSARARCSPCRKDAV